MWSDEQVRGCLDPAHGGWNSREDLRDSAVLLILVERGGADSVVFQRRRDDLPAHAGQVSFPGGVSDPGEDAVACALRETCEEIGVPTDAFDVLGRLPDRISIAGFLVAAFVARMRAPGPYLVSEDEVAEVFEVPLADLLVEERWYFRPTRHRIAMVSRVPHFDHDGHTIWGLTGIIVRDFLKAMRG